MDEQLSWFISNCSLYSIAIPAIVGTWSYKRLNHIQKLLFFLVLLTVITESTAYWLEHNTNNQQVIYHIFTLIDFLHPFAEFFQSYQHPKPIEGRR